MSQWPKAGTLVRKGSTVNIEMAKRPSYIVPPTPTIKQCTVPNLIGMNRNQAIELLNRSGFRWVEKWVRGREEDGGKIIRQEPGPNSQAPCGSSITIFIGQIVIY
jgi:beta-lactam-binding protein with PASTA domain